MAAAVGTSASAGNGKAQRRNRLPTLAEVLKRTTRPPVDLYCYYLFLQREGSEDALDFWLDVQQHENLCRAYFKDLRKSGRSVKDEWPHYYQHARTRGSVYAAVTGVQKGDDPDEPIMATPYGTFRDEEKAAMARTPSPSAHHGPRSSYPMSPTIQALYPHDSDQQMKEKRSSTARPFIPRDAAIERSDLVAGAERIYSRYLMPGAEKEIYLPADLRIPDFPISSSTLPPRDHPDYDIEAEAQGRVPDMFHAQKEYIYRAMEQDSFPRFLRAKAFGNLTPMSALVRLAFGLLALWAAFATAFSFIFLDTKPKIKRLWIILPFTFAIVNIVAHSYDLDPILVFMGLSETRPFRTIGIREPYVRKLLFGRALWVTFLSTVIIAVLVVIFALVPGHRL